MGLLLLLAAGSGRLFGVPAWGTSWTGLALGVLLVGLGLLGEDRERRR